MQMRSNRGPWRTFALGGVLLAFASPAGAGLYRDTFDDLNPGVATLNDDAVMGTYLGDGGVRLTRAEPGLFGSLQLPVLDPAVALSEFGVIASYATPDVQSNPTGFSPDPRVRGTGMGLFFGQFNNGQDFDRQGPIAGQGGPTGPANGLAIEFDTVADSSPAGIRVYVNDILIAQDQTRNPATTDIFSYEVRYFRNSPSFGSLFLSLDDNTVPGPVVIFDNIFLPFVPQAGDRFALTGSSDNDVNRVWITDLTVGTVPEPASLALAAGVGAVGMTRYAFGRRAL